MSDTMSDRSISSSDRGAADISVIVPVYNRERLLPAMLRSLENQTVRPREAIFIDNNSSDATPQILRDWKSRMELEGWNVSVLSIPEKGAALARKKGEEIATSTYLSFFDSDDVMHPDFLEKAMKDFTDDPSLDITAWSVTFVNPDGSRRKRRIIPGRALENHLVQGLLSTQAYAVRRDFLLKAGGWNPAIGGWDDWELGLRLLLTDPKIKITDESRADLTVQEDSISGMSYLHRKGDWEKTVAEMQRQISLPHPGITPQQSRFVTNLLAYRMGILAAHYYREKDHEGASDIISSLNLRKDLTKTVRLVIKSAYLFTRMGINGAGAVFPPIIRHL